MAAKSSQRATLSSRSGWRYDVFLSFRGETRLIFTDHLYSALQSKGVVVFRDEEKLEPGENIRPLLCKAIHESEYKVIVISKNYASSTWCLDELIEIVKCKGNKVLPVFYDVDPSDVRKQKGSFATAFAEHTEKNVDEKQMNMWRDALKEVCKLTGWDVRGRHESEVVKKICTKIFYGLSRPLLDIDDDLVGIKSQIEELMILLDMRDEDEDNDVFIREGDVRFLGIWGMGGVGKTTLAEVIYNRVSLRFDGRCFISNVREKSRDLICLQQQLISCVLGEEESLIRKKICTISEGRRTIASMFQNKKVLIVLDDVNEENQLEALAGKTDWFGKGSRILITSRDRRVFNKRVNKNSIFEVKELSYYDALWLFQLKAFDKPCYQRSYMKVAKDIVKYAGGLPLALKIFGSLLFDSKIEAWESALCRIKADPDANILDRLQISFEGLGISQRKLFLDIACFFRGESVCDATCKLKDLGHFPEFDVSILVSKSLIRISGDIFEMHDLLQEMGRRIILLESLGEPGERSRLWCQEDIIHVLNNNTGTDVVEAIFLKLPLPKPIKLNFEGFLKMKKLRMLVIRPINCYKAYIGTEKTLKDLSSVEWHGNPLDFMISNRLHILEWWGYPFEDLPANFEPNNLAELKLPMSNIKQLGDATKNFDKLKYIDLSDLRNSIKILDFSKFPNLEELRGGGSFLRPVTFLLPHLSLFSKFLKNLELVYCNLSDGALPTDLGCLSLLEVLNLSGNSFTKIDDLSQLSRLLRLSLDNCSRLKELPPNFSLRLWWVSLRNCPSLVTFSKPRDKWTSSKVLVAGGSSVVATYFGYNGRRDRTLHLALPSRGSNPETKARLVFQPLSWGPTLTSDISEWFYKTSAGPDISGTFRCQIDFDISGQYCGVFGLSNEIVLFIVYEVLPLNGCQRKRERETQKIDDCENSSSRIFPVFDLEFQVNKFIPEGEVPSGKRNVPIVIRVPEVPSVGRNGIWVVIPLGCFSNYSTDGSCSVTISSPNVQVKECGGRAVLHCFSECYEIISRISPHYLASEHRENGFHAYNFHVSGPIKRARAGR